MAKTRRSYQGGAASTTISTSIAASGATTFAITAYTGWPYGSAPFFVVVEPGTSNEEKMLVTRSGATDTGVNIYTVPSVAANRGMDGTTAFLHAAGSTIFPVFTATDADEANEIASTLTTQGDILIHGASTFGRVGIGTAAEVLKVNSSSTAPEWGQVATAGIADDAITAAKIATGAVGSDEIASNSVTTAKILDANVTAAKLASDSVTTAKIVNSNVTTEKIADSSVTSAKIATGVALSKLAAGALPTTITVASANIENGCIVNDDINGGAAIALSKLNTGALPSAITVSSANIVSNTIVNADVNASAGIFASKLAGVFTTASGANRTITISTAAPSGGSDGDIWFKY